MGTVLKPAGMGWEWKESLRGEAGFGINYVDAERVEVVPCGAGMGSNLDPASLSTCSYVYFISEMERLSTDLGSSGLRRYQCDSHSTT